MLRIHTSGSNEDGQWDHTYLDHYTPLGVYKYLKGLDITKENRIHYDHPTSAIEFRKPSDPTYDEFRYRITIWIHEEGD